MTRGLLGRGHMGRLAVGLLALAVQACDAGSAAPSDAIASALPPSSGGPVVEPTSAASLPAAPLPTIDPVALAASTLTCGIDAATFSPDALAGPGAELAPDAAAAALREFLLTEPAPAYPFPRTGWHRVVETPERELFIASTPSDPPWLAVAFTRSGATSGPRCLRAMLARRQPARRHRGGGLVGRSGGGAAQPAVDEHLDPAPGDLVRRRPAAGRAHPGPGRRLPAGRDHRDHGDREAARGLGLPGQPERAVHGPADRATPRPGAAGWCDGPAAHPRPGRLTRSQRGAPTMGDP